MKIFIPAVGVLHLAWVLDKALFNIPSLLMVKRILAPALTQPRVAEKNDTLILSMSAMENPQPKYLEVKSPRGARLSAKAFIPSRVIPKPNTCA